MKKQLPLMLVLALIFSVTFFGCSPESEALEESACDCDKVTYVESKYQEETTNEWLLEHLETNREDVQCQPETDYSIPPVGSLTREVHRIECN
ncbi:hypothetical protein [Winogradskyella sp. PG-2]|uniref:hypothetical protein n=1 Tax=Winogradskyella sp. PG-2 TaxID=754409 RepID=UPI001185726D|nr:hypothetical protein [Winogradskyella sp. PG-2]